MAKEDIYKNKHRYERFIENSKYFYLKPNEQRLKTKSRRLPIYYCKNKENIKYYEKLFLKFDSKDISFIRRLRVLANFKIILHSAHKDLIECTREDIDRINAYQHTRNHSSKSKRDFIRDLKYIWKILFPDLDEKGRPDDSNVPYAVRHLKELQDKSREIGRDDKISIDEYKRIVSYFSNEKSLKAFITLAVESLARPQELCYMQIKDFEFNDNFAKGNLSSHTKEGIGIIQVFDSFPYVLDWYNAHPFKDNKNAYFFLNQNHEQLTPASINKRLRLAIKELKIDKTVTCYSLKRNGVTFDLLAGKKPQTIQHKARWSSLKQLQTYSKMNQQDNFYLEGIKKGKITDPKIIARYQGLIETDIRESNKCVFCNHIVGFEEKICPNCKRLTDKKELKKEIELDKIMNSLLEDKTIKDLIMQRLKHII